MTRRRASAGAAWEMPRTRRNNWRLLQRVLLLLLLAEVGAAVWSSPIFWVREVTVEGIALTRPEEVVHVMRLGERNNWVFLSPSRLAQRLQSLPAVADAVVARRIWGKVSVRVFERQPLALLRTTKGSYWIDARGVPFWRTEQAAGLPEIHVQAPFSVTLGRAVSNKSVQSALEILYRYVPEHHLPVAQIVVDREGNLCLNMKGRLPRVKIGDSTGLARKMARAAELWQQPQLVQQAEYLDVSYVDKPVWKPRANGKGAAQ
ncbi:MAG: FtsQ-type POTRA domain-containing protein [Armatimonadota bacterium]|nr:FtsQ-type POTRA domain-containing protein [bacterium]MCS7308875.1 FtsQ-type POTRA domain-containing protein [Armatimonadota bacterium]MDW8103405.1 FtsQ-type POTRA domain-containing protein [Armatimonadota bacterium]MDW8290475.1 FtsQ-type POTRA domain-containing protein [Armatimonadota bacterium]